MPITAILIGTAVSAGLGAGITAATAPDQPETPDYSKANEAAVRASMATLPGQRMVEAAARLGTKVQYPTGRVVPAYEDRPVFVGPGGQTRPAAPGETPPPGFVLTTQPVQVGMAPEMATADFTGIGDIDTARKTASDMASAQLALSRKYGAQFIDSAREQERLADPDGWAARQLLHNEIQRLGLQSGANPVAAEMDRQLLQELQLGGRLAAPAQTAVAASAVHRAAAGDASTLDLGSLLGGEPGRARALERQQKALAWLSSGASPEDAAYRRQQQQLANMASFISGQTPVSQFTQLSGAQQGASPFIAGPALPASPNPAAAAAATANAGAYYAQDIRNQLAQPNPWLAGLSSVLQLGGLGKSSS